MIHKKSQRERLEGSPALDREWNMTALTTEPAEIVHVPLGDRSYEIRVGSQGAEGFGSFALEALRATWAGRSCRLALIITDENVEPLTAPFVEALREFGMDSQVRILPPGEPTKCLERAAELYDHLIALRADRHTAIVAFGGGVVGDLAGFVAATYARGLPLLMVPTSLLAQVDSSVGGKVGLNRPGAKNIVGAFHQPTGVWIDTGTLAGLPARELRCGLAEVVKYGVILDAPFFEELERLVDPILALEPRTIRRVVAHCCRLKADVVSQDEREQTGLRAVLNFGHTIGHAIEAVAGYSGDYRHGEAVAIGMVAEARLAERLAWIDTETTDRLQNLLRRFGLPVTAPALDPNALLEAMTRDKKNQGGRVRFVLPRRIGQVELTEAPGEADLDDAVLSVLIAPKSGG